MHFAYTTSTMMPSLPDAAASNEPPRPPPPAAAAARAWPEPHQQAQLLAAAAALEERLDQRVEISPAIAEALDRIDLMPYTAEDLEGISQRIEPVVDLVTLSIVNAGPLREVDVQALTARLQSDSEPPIEYLRLEQCDMSAGNLVRILWNALPEAPALKVFSATSCNFYEEETVCALFRTLSVCGRIQDVYFRDAGQSLPESTGALSASIGRLLQRKYDTLRLLSLACNEHVDIDLHLEQGLRSMANRCNLRHLNLWMNDLGDDRTLPILNTLSLPGWYLCSLDLAENNLTPSLLPSISHVMNNCRHSLRLLRLSDNPRLLSSNEAKPSDIRSFLQTFRHCRKMQSLSVDQCGLNGPLALSIFESCLTHTTSTHHVPLRQISMQNNSSIGQTFWRRIIHEVIPRLATLKTLFFSDFEYESSMQACFAKNMVLEHVEPAWFTSRSELERSLTPILERNRVRNQRYQQVQYLLRPPRTDEGMVTPGIQAAAVRRLVQDGVAGKAALFLILSRLVETSHSLSRHFSALITSATSSISSGSSMEDLEESEEASPSNGHESTKDGTTNARARDAITEEPTAKRHRVCD